MALIQILVPLFDKDGQPYSSKLLRAIEQELTSKFGGVTSYVRSPARGRWVDDQGDVERDDVVICEVMVDAVDRAWWRQYKADLERRLRQSELVVRSVPIELL